MEACFCIKLSDDIFDKEYKRTWKFRNASEVSGAGLLSLC
jgi:hypothetical protein